MSGSLAKVDGMGQQEQIENRLNFYFPISWYKNYLLFEMVFLFDTFS